MAFEFVAIRAPIGLCGQFERDSLKLPNLNQLSLKPEHLGAEWKPIRLIDLPSRPIGTAFGHVLIVIFELD